MEGPTRVSFDSIIYRLNGVVENIFSDSSIFTRVFLMRLVSLVFGCGIILVGYLIFLEVGLKKKHSLLLTSVVSFQPMLSMSASTINYDIVFIFSFALFSLASIRIINKKFHWKNFALFVFSFFLALYSKGTGLIVVPISVLLVVYLLFHVNQKISFYKKSAILVSILFFSIVFLFAFPDNKISSTVKMGSSNAFSSISDSFSEYSEKTLNLDQFLRTNTSYWGNFGWLDSNLPKNLIIFISFFELLGFVGFLLFIIMVKSKKILSVNKKSLLFLLFLVVLLQLGIRFWDWKFFYEHGNLGIGTPGRYFLPNIVAHFLFVTIGFGFLLRKEAFFNLFLKIALIFSILLFFYSTFLILIPRYYL
jgi:4-amino-4-deoxy-L-arabinose transferase-like glycosyltransferase